MVRRAWRWIAVAIGTLMVGALLAWSFMARPIEVETAQAEVRLFQEWIEDDGRARVRERVAVTMPWTGVLERPTYREGHTIRTDEPLFWVRPVQPTMLDARTRAEWQARSASAQAAWQRASRQTEVAVVAWQRAAVTAARTVMLAEQSFVSRAQVETSVLDLQREERSWQAAQAAERAALHELEQTRVALVTGAVTPEGDRRLSVEGRRAVRMMDAMGMVPRADAVKVLRLAQAHEAVLPAGTVVMEVGDVQRPEVVVPLLSQDALRIRVGSRAYLSAWDRGMPANARTAAPSGGGGPTPAPLQAGRVEGTVRLIEPVASTKTSALGVEEQRVNVVIEPRGELPPGDGYTVRVQIVLREEAQALQVPVSAVFPQPGDPSRHAVFTVDKGRAQRVAVELQARAGTSAWVSGGLKAGQVVIVFPPASLEDGARVRAMPGHVAFSAPR
jgi:HlyD family secretion protein